MSRSLYALFALTLTVQALFIGPPALRFAELPLVRFGHEWCPAILAEPQRALCKPQQRGHREGREERREGSTRGLIVRCRQEERIVIAKLSFDKKELAHEF